MKHTKSLLTLTLITLAFVGVLFAPAFTHAQGPDIIQAEVDRTSLSTDESLVLTVTINAASGRPSQPVLPPMAGLQIVGQSSGTSIQIINGDITTQMTYQYRLQPTQAGDFVIDAISTTVNGQTFSTEPIMISVAQGSGMTQSASGLNRQVAATETPTELAGQDFFVEAEVDNPTPYQGQQILHTFVSTRQSTSPDGPNMASLPSPVSGMIRKQSRVSITPKPPDALISSPNWLRHSSPPWPVNSSSTPPASPSPAVSSPGAAPWPPNRWR